MNNSNLDTKKIIRMVAVIGILLIFVGIASRIRQNSQLTLSKYASGSQDTDAESSGDAAQSSNTSDDSESNEYGEYTSAMTDEEYASFYYTDNDNGTSNVNIMYYIYSEKNYQILKGTLVCDSDIAYDLLDIFYNLYRNKYPLTIVAGDPSFVYSDECTDDYENKELKSNNVTYCKGKNVYINPLYNPAVSYDDNGEMNVIPDDSNSSYEDRVNNKGMYFIDREDLAYYLFTQKGFLWGGDMSGNKDYSLFYKE